MKVLCIDAKQKIPSKHNLKEGTIYTASQCPIYKNNYELAEYMEHNGVPCSFGKYRFIPLSDIDETEFVREYKTETA